MGTKQAQTKIVKTTQERMIQSAMMTDRSTRCF
jgi:hypothetical protein